LEAKSPASKIRFDSFEVDPSTRELRKHGSRLKLSEQPFQALVLLLDRAGELVTREEFQRRLWTDGVFVDFERGLNKVINRLREVLGDDAERPKYIETLPQRGYRFIGEIRVELLPTPPAPVQTLSNDIPVEAAVPAAQAGIGRRSLIFGAAGAAALGTGFAAWRWWNQSRIESIAVLPLDNLSGDPEQEFFADGMTDELTGELARIQSLRVISRTSAMRSRTLSPERVPPLMLVLMV